jgi:hypothetical protein
VARPGSGKHLWLEQGGNQWNIADGGQPPSADQIQRANSQSQPEPEHHALEQEIVLRIEPLWLSNFGISAMFLSQSVLVALANISHDRRRDRAARAGVARKRSLDRFTNRFIIKV